ncbi:hypothetical protein [Nocardia cyriacigeorgica]|uniref:hypothetical protein n=1 Tax=Nocardia cyriacigeorgica TaxID=135487 RepID=UPI001894D5D8|nr:hypothetical protein [Nocardia cyriacigeorgica]MBF6099140.1 hypothetical protein [Nocardia cyriacigeorgica]MBF6319789.1 hypothetical protein [Nocardia cyriacigeorgica]MBF6533486.1 hypothetical protein [Nocardia cyriacigeorgica]
MFAPVPSLDPHAALLADAAFGARPGTAAAELPAARDAREAWLRAVALGGQGRYAAARAELRRLTIHRADPVLASLAAATRGSLLRQLGWHAVAAGHDGAAAALVLPGLAEEQSEDRRGPDRLDAACDALTGLAADALGTGRTDLAADLLARVRTLLGEATEAPGPDRLRPAIRLRWVSAETALAAGRSAAALPHAEAGLALAEQGPSVRHRVKSRLLLAAATAAVGSVDRAGELAETVAAECREHRLLPLRWACAMLRTGVAARDIDRTAAQREAAECAAAIERLGGRFRPAVAG